MSIRKITLAIFVLCALALFQGTSFATDPGAGTGVEYSLQMTVNLVTNQDPNNWQDTDLDTSLADFGITAPTFDDLLDEALILLDPQGGSWWHGTMLPSSWDSSGDWSDTISFRDGVTTVSTDNWLDTFEDVWLGIYVPGWYPELANMSWTEASDLTINDILAL
jgi:hypothetical protein